MADSRAFMELLTTPLVLAPMAGGISTPELAVAATKGGAFAFLAGALLNPDDLAADLKKFRDGSPDPFGVNLFVPPSGPGPDAEQLSRYRAEVQGEAARFDVRLPEVLPTGAVVGLRTDDWFTEKIELLLADPVPAVSFTFGLPDKVVLTALRRQGTVLIATVTNPAEAIQACESDVDVLCVQAASAGGHRGTFGNYAGSNLYLPALIKAVTDVSSVGVIAAGGIARKSDVAAGLTAGALAVQAGTAFLAAPESGAPQAHKAALTAPGSRTAVSRAFTGRFARGIVNDFMLDHGSTAPAAYPQVHALTGPIRRAAAQQGDDSAMSMWAGEGHRLAEAIPATAIALKLLDL